ncbi:MAG: hypothetical protein AB7L17_05880 [Ilumatobacteraceae bacterium]
MRPTLPRERDSTADLVAFQVEGSGYYLVPLGALAPYEVDAVEPGDRIVPLGWGWALPIVRWNTFHISQVGMPIALARGVVAALAARHFVSSPTEGNTP